MEERISVPRPAPGALVLAQCSADGAVVWTVATDKAALGEPGVMAALLPVLDDAEAQLRAQGPPSQPEISRGEINVTAAQVSQSWQPSVQGSRQRPVFGFARGR